MSTKKLIISSLCLIIFITACDKNTHFTETSSANKVPESSEKSLNINSKNSELNGYHDLYYDIINQSFFKCKDFDKLSKINFNPCNEIEKELYKAGYDIKRLKNFQFDMVNILDNNNRDIVMKVTIVEGKDKIKMELLMTFIYSNGKYNSVGSIFANSYINSYELVDIDGDNNYEIVVDYDLFNTKRWLEIYKCNNNLEWECIFKTMDSNLIYVEKYPYKFLDGFPKKLVIQKDKYHYNSVTQDDIISKIEYMFEYNGKKYELNNQKTLDTEEIIYPLISDENAVSNLQLIQESYTNCKDYKWLNKLNFFPSEDIDNSIKNHTAKIQKLYDFKFEKCSIWGKDNKDIIMRVTVETEVDSFELLMVFINKDDRYHLVGTLRSSGNSIEYELLDINNDDKPEMVSNRVSISNGAFGLLEIYQFNNTEGWECIFKNGNVNLHLFEIDYKFADGNPKKLLIDESRMYYNINNQQKKAEIIQYIFLFNGDQFELDESKNIWKSKMEDFKTYIIGKKMRSDWPLDHWIV
jgi:hypothetical protein